jgi:hypothetical protein
MRGKLLGVMTGVALLASVGVASAGQRVALTDAQLDKVTAGGFAFVSAEWVNGSGTASASGFASTTSASASITATFTSQGTGTPHEVIVSSITGLP